MTTCIYKITSPVGSVYIGQSREFERRFSFYRRGHAKNQLKLNGSFNKYGFINHSFKIIHELPKDISVEHLDNYEVFYLNAYTRTGVDLLNIREGGRSGIFPEYVKVKKSNSMRGRVPHNKGIPHSIETKEKMRAARKGRVFTEECRKKISLFHKGKPKSEQTRKKLSEANLGKKHSDEARLKMSKTRKGKKFSPEHAAKLAIVLKKHRKCLSATA